MLYVFKFRITIKSFPLLTLGNNTEKQFYIEQ